MLHYCYEIILKVDHIMENKKEPGRRVIAAFYDSCFLVIILVVLFFPSFGGIGHSEENYFHVILNGSDVGIVSSREEAEKCLIAARRVINRDSDHMILVKSDMVLHGRTVFFGRTDTESYIISNMTDALKKGIKDTQTEAYTVKIKQYTVNLANSDDVTKLLKDVLGKYDSKSEYAPELINDPTRQLSALTAQVTSKKDIEKKTDEEQNSYFGDVGVFAALDKMFEDTSAAKEKDFADYDLGLMSIDFADKVEVIQTYIPSNEISSLNAAIDDVTKDKEKKQIYEVKSGDTLSQIAESFGLSMDDLLAMNSGLDGAGAMIREGDELTVTVPEPELSVTRQEQVFVEEDYEADIIYKDNDSWFTNQSEVIQQPSAGHRKAIALITYTDDKEVLKEIEKQEITMEAVPKIIERGTKVPPTYIKPISGGRLTSGFGRRKQPKKGASTYHKGIDWATPVGTAVMASSAGTVVRAGWGSGYGKVVYIQHSDGRMTRYGHLSKIIVKVGDHVDQGQKIALSGNTGVSTGAHLHFEILIGGVQVNPLKYLN